MGDITWPVAATIISGLVVLFGFLVQIYGRKNLVIKDDFDALAARMYEADRLIEHRTTVLEGKIDTLTRSIDDAKQALALHTDVDNKNFDRIDDRLEKITDLMIDMIQNERK